MLYIIMMIFAGCLVAMQNPINAALGKNIGMLEGALINFAVGLCVLGLLTAGFGKGCLMKAATALWWQWLGGCFGAMMVFSAIISVPRIGALPTMLAMITGNLIMASVIDNFGWFAAPVHIFTQLRLLGLLFVAIGLILVFKS